MTMEENDMDALSAANGSDVLNADHRPLDELPPGPAAKPGAAVQQRNGTISPRRISVWLAIVSFCSFAYFIPHWDWNQAARMDMIVAAANQGNFAIDKYQDNTGDKDYYQGHYYSSKAPGQSLVGIPIYILYEGYMNFRGTPPQDRADDWAAQYLEVLATVMVPATLFVLLLFWFLGYFSTSLLNRTIVTLGIGLGTDFFAYAHELFGHVTVAVLLFTGFTLVYIIGRDDAIRGPWTRRLVQNPDATALLAGAVLGLAVLFEYPPALIALLIGIYALTRLRPGHIVYMAVGAAPALMIVVGYNTAVYRNPLIFGYTSGASVNFAQQQRMGFGGFAWPPSFEAIYSLSIFPYRGLFFMSPFLLLAFPGYFLWKRRGGSEWLLFLAIPVLFFFAITMFSGWWGGLATGPRYLIPMIPFLGFPVIFVLDGISRLPRRTTMRWLVYGLIALSVVITWAQTITGYAPEGERYPLFAQTIPTLEQNYIYLNRGQNLGLDGTQALIPLFAFLVVCTLIVFRQPLWKKLSARLTRIATEPLEGGDAPRLQTFSPSASDTPNGSEGFSAESAGDDGDTGVNEAMAPRM
jgi:hypothetical protein